MNELKYAACQNGVILDVFDTKDAAVSRVHQEMKKDFLSIVLRKKLRKLIKGGNVALHSYTVITLVSIEEVSE